jgi:hypothetical protein
MDYIAGENLDVGDLVYQKDGKYFKAKSDAALTFATDVVIASGLEGMMINLSKSTTIHKESWNFNTTKRLFLSNVDAGTITEQETEQLVGYANSNTDVSFSI